MNKVRLITRIFRRAYSNSVNVGVKEELNVVHDSEQFGNVQEYTLKNQDNGLPNDVDVQNHDTIQKKEVPLANTKKLLTFNEYTKDRLIEIYKGSPEKAITLLHEYKKYVEAEKNAHKSDTQENLEKSDV